MKQQNPKSVMSSYITYDPEQNMTKIKAAIVPEEDRMDFLPTHVGANRMMHVEANLFGNMAKMCEEYKGGYWDFYELSNGGFMMLWDPDLEQVKVTTRNGYHGYMSPRAASLVAMLYTLNAETWEVQTDKSIDNYNWLRDYAIEDAEMGKILAAID